MPGASARPIASPSSNHPRGRAILDRPAGILPFGLGVQLDAGRLALEAVQPHERRAADEIEHAPIAGGRRPRTQERQERSAT